MKLSKDQIQKIVLGVLAGLGVVYGYFTLLLFPLQASHNTTKKSIAALDPEIAKARAQLARDADVRQQAPLAQATLAQIDRMIPEGAPVAWFPTRIGEFFKTRGIDRATTRLNAEVAHPKLPGYRRITWGVEVPRAECLTLGTTIAALENEELLVSIESISIETQREEPDTQRVQLTLINMVKQ
ncbi:MAG: hypothetical protein ABMA13_09305 [Chthoniobacteraceae bacterium]